MKCEEKEKKYYNRESQDNILRKINGHYISLYFFYNKLY